MAAKVKKESTHNVEFAKGGNDHMFPAQSADKAEKGVTRDTTATDDNPHPSKSTLDGAKGGSGKMFGFQPANSQVAGRTSSY